MVVLLGLNVIAALDSPVETTPTKLAVGNEPELDTGDVTFTFTESWRPVTSTLLPVPVATMLPRLTYFELTPPLDPAV